MAASAGTESGHGRGISKWHSFRGVGGTLEVQIYKVGKEPIKEWKGNIILCDVKGSNNGRHFRLDFG
jgi:hypothetical protein